mgnify:CR=1 FL=1
MISAGEVHMPGRPTGAIGTKSMAIVGAKSWSSYRPGGMKVQGGGLLLQAGLTETDFKEMASSTCRFGFVAVKGCFCDYP